jgi:hypothetical protein
MSFDYCEMKASPRCALVLHALTLALLFTACATPKAQERGQKMSLVATCDVDLSSRICSELRQQGIIAIGVSHGSVDLCVMPEDAPRAREALRSFQKRSGVTFAVRE